MASVQRLRDIHTVPTVKVGAIVRVHVPELQGLWRVDAVLVGGSWGYFLRISQRVAGGKISRTIAPRGYQIITGEEETL
jgi:hypothetical protein